MLFDEKDFRVFDNPDSRNYFKEILQSYYSQNYRATIVLLYSFVIYDLFFKLQNMANEGDKKATSKIEKINTMISDDEKYSKVENEVIQFFKDNCPLYFDRFIEDIEYLKNCRNKCAHLKVSDDSLFVPKDYHARMLICSMYDHILSVKAPFITDLFSIAQKDVERYAQSISHIPQTGLDEAIMEYITEKYLNRMTYDSLKNSYKTFIRLLFVSDDENCIKNIYGLYAFAYTMTDFAIKKGYGTLFKEETTLKVFSRINIESLKENSTRANALIAIITLYPVVMDIIRGYEDVFEYIRDRVLTDPNGLKFYQAFYPREEKNIYEYFKENESIRKPSYINSLYNTVKECENFDLFEFTQLMVKSIPKYYGFYDADCFMFFFKDHMKDLTTDEIKEIVSVYRTNDQCTKRLRHSSDIEEIMNHIKEREDNSTDSKSPAK